MAELRSLGSASAEVRVRKTHKLSFKTNGAHKQPATTSSGTADTAGASQAKVRAPR
jgi:hypothetical protein